MAMHFGPVRRPPARVPMADLHSGVSQESDQQKWKPVFASDRTLCRAAAGLFGRRGRGLSTPSQGHRHTGSPGGQEK